MDDISRGIQAHVSKRRVVFERSCSVLALQRHDFHIPRQRLILQLATYGGDVDITLARGNGAEFDIVLHSCGFAIGISFSNRADGSNVDIFDIIFRGQVHNLTLQGGIVKLSNAARFGADIQCGLVMRVRHIARQIDAATGGVGAGNVDAALFYTN